MCRNIVYYLISFFLTFFCYKSVSTPNNSIIIHIQFRAKLKYLKVCRPGAINKFSNVKEMNEKDQSGMVEGVKIRGGGVDE